jgi:pyruvate formate lyase activating enzyme
MNPHPEVLFNPELCIGCGACAAVCPSGAIAAGTGPDRALCADCTKCAEVCYAEALHIKGEYMTPRAVLDEALKDKLFYKRTGGGVTFSGGEPVVQVDFLEETLRLCKENGLNTAIETCGYAPWENYERIAPFVDVFLFDIKSTDSAKHREYTGVPCERIMENCAKLTKIARRLIVRVPVIPEFNCDRESLTNIVRFAESIGVKEVNFLPYHRMAASKYEFLGRAYWNPGMDRLEDSLVEECVSGIETPIRIELHG